MFMCIFVQTIATHPQIKHHKHSVYIKRHTNTHTHTYNHEHNQTTEQFKLI